MRDAPPAFVIVGAGLAGGRAAEALRREGFDGRVVLVGDERDPPYDRPPLSKEYLRGQMERSRLFIHDPEVYERQGIDLRLGVRAVRLDPEARVVELDTGERLGFERLLLATGGRVRRLAAEGGHLMGVHYLRTIGESEAIGAELRPGARLVVVGAGFIGSEVAASARQKGLSVTVLEIAEAPLERALGTEMGQIYAEIHREHGVHLRTGEGVVRIEGDERVRRVVTTSGAVVECDAVVIGVGIEPETTLAQQAGLAVDNGVVVDEYCETSHPGIFATGDVANFLSPVLGERLRVEHWANAQNQAVAAARNMLGRHEPYAEVPWFWSDQYELNMQYVGHASGWDEVVLRGDVQGRRFTAFYVKDGLLRAAMAVNRHRDVPPSRELIRRRIPVLAARLRDPDFELRSLLP